MNYDTDEEVKNLEPGNHQPEAVRYSHPSWGMIRVHRQHGGKEEPLFGSEVGSNTQIAITIEHADLTQDLGRNWIFSNEQICQIIMTPVQYAEMLSNPNTEGVPCTINFTQKLGTIKYKGHNSRMEYVESKLDSKVSELKEDTKNIEEKVKEILDKKGALNKSDKAQINSLVRDLVCSFNSSLPFYEEQLSKSINRQKMEAKTQVESYLSHAINRMGLKALQDPENLKLVFKDDEESNN